ncbi:hypothetical protein OE88DRAFT_1712963 [Heliocybe sulcata]|uniref:CoA-dependent acyltransferase n=1 Tax=Heliocybe sulcata TaxID=5364 RepID=A0A5C3N056_9AGAM|nr:hypothetical protein OE88DRAFT_1712963 [Heliocybe sulcata]
MSAPTFAPMDFSRYVWRVSPDDSSKYLREAAGGEVIEDVWNRFNHGEQNLFLAADLELSVDTPVNDFIARAKAAWLAMRFSLPIVAANTEQDEAGNSLVTYKVPHDQQEALEWASRTVRLYEGTTDLDELRYRIGQNKIPEPNGDQTFLYFVTRSSTSYGLLMHTHHTPFDGAGTKIAITKYLQILAPYLSVPSLASKQFQWGKEVENLTPVASEILAPSEPREGEPYNQTLAGVMGDLAAAMPRQYGFKTRDIGPGPTRRASYTFAPEESAKIIQNARSLGYTITQVAHGAVCLVCASDNPPNESTPDDASFVFYGLVDSRARLAAPWSSREGYPGYCLGMSAIVVPVKLVQSSAAEGEKAQLLKLADAVKQEYAKQKSYPSLLAIEAQEVEMMLAGLRSGAPPPPPWMGPWFAGDGIGETYLQPEYKDSQGNVVVKVTDFFNSLNKTDPGPFFRVHSWNKRLTLAADYNEVAMPRDVVDGFIKKWAELMSILL